MVHLARYALSPLRDVACSTLRILVFADPHCCTPFMSLDRLSGLVAKANALEPDLTLLLGDYTGHVLGGWPIDAGSVALVLAGLRARVGVFAVFGNHDWRDDPDAQVSGAPTLWHRAFADAGIATLSNEAIKMDVGVPLQVLGLESQRARQTFLNRRVRGHDDWPKLDKMRDPDVFTILMAHEPDIFPDLPQGIDLTVSGHTHGGQIAPFGLPLIVPSKYGRRYAYGRHRNGRNTLIVSGGLGCSGLPLRLGRPAELTVIEVA